MLPGTQELRYGIILLCAWIYLSHCFLFRKMLDDRGLLIVLWSLNPTHIQDFCTLWIIAWNTSIHLAKAVNTIRRQTYIHLAVRFLWRTESLYKGVYTCYIIILSKSQTNYNGKMPPKSVVAVGHRMFEVNDDYTKYVHKDFKC